MIVNNETHAEAVAALRRWGKCHFARSAKIREFCDRIEAAHRHEMSKIVSKNGADFGQLGDAAARKRIATPAEGMPPKRDAHRGAHPETAESCLGTGEMENRQTVQIGEVSGGGRAEAKPRTATAGADPEPAKSLVNATENGRRSVVNNDVLKREINHSYIAQDVQVAIDTILAYAYTLTLENQVLRRRLEDAKRLLDDREIDREIVATHLNTEASASTRIRKIVNETPPATEKEGGAE